ncbi:hypothetical protein B6G06_05580 [Actinomyces gaoshouyii]|uniref:Uncharacterized protein n=2 Tax=Actinomyces gaoshouyii TaxID=1960083 RepID=A0A8H9HE49_9ACTO|nr:hypothetical protein [Actinomyces gaoshouyii]ARD41872.1 hypothetical protein B6G06_05580 [Actinomyces gaoshouyii]GGO99982.1 hypothetical protein GCM10011612_18550 [Actinomyces gaoshouyii]
MSSCSLILVHSPWLPGPGAMARILAIVGTIAHILTLLAGLLFAVVAVAWLWVNLVGALRRTLIGWYRGPGRRRGA